MPKANNIDTTSSSSGSSSGNSNNDNEDCKSNSRNAEQQQPAKRVKVTLACTICRKKKVKCDGVQPTCSRCHSIGINCQYSDPPKKRGPPKGYVEVITNRAHRIESLLSAGGHHPQQQNAQQQSVQQQIKQEQYNVLAGTIEGNHPNNADFAANMKHRQQHQQQPINNLVQSIADRVHAALFLQQQQHLAGFHQYEGPAARHNYLHDSNGFLYDFSTFRPTGSSSYISKPYQHCATTAPFVQQHEIAWTENFFNYFNVIFPLLLRPQYMHQLVRHEVSPILKLAVCILGCRFDSNNNNHGLNDNDKNNNNNSKEHEHQHQRQQQLHEAWLYAQFFNDYGPALVSSSASHDISTVQAVIIMCWYTYLAGDMHRCYSLRQLLASIVNKLQLAYEASPQATSLQHRYYQHGGDDYDIFHTEMRRRAFWVAYVIDLWLAASNLPANLTEHGHGENRTSRYMLVEQADKKWNCKYPQFEDNQLFALYQFYHHDQLKHEQSGLNSNGPNMNTANDTPPALSSLSTSFSVESAFQVNSFTEMICLFKIVSRALTPVTMTAHTGLAVAHEVQGTAGNAALEAKLTEWFLNLPSYLDCSKMANCNKQDQYASSSAIARIYRILYYTVQIMLNHNVSTEDYCEGEDHSQSHKKSNKRSALTKNGGLSNSICTTAATTIVHISEQMLEEQQEKFLYNVFFLSLTSSTSVHLNNAIVPNSSSSANRIHLHKTISLMKRINCSVLPSPSFDQLIDNFLLEVCSISLDDTGKDGVNRHEVYQHQQQQQLLPTHSSSSLETTIIVPKAGIKRVYQPDDDALKVEDWLFNETYPLYNNKVTRPTAIVMTSTNTITTSNSSNSSCSPPSTPPSFHPTEYHLETLSSMTTPFLNDDTIVSVPQTSPGLPIDQQRPFFNPTTYCSESLSAPQQLQLIPHASDSANYSNSNSICWSTINDWTDLIDITNNATTETVATTSIGTPIPYCFTPTLYPPSTPEALLTTVTQPPSTPLIRLKDRKDAILNPLVAFNFLQGQHQFF